jgi:hypothetical protein
VEQLRGMFEINTSHQPMATCDRNLFAAPRTACAHVCVCVCVCVVCVCVVCVCVVCVVCVWIMNHR